MKGWMTKEINRWKNFPSHHSAVNIIHTPSQRTSSKVRKVRDGKNPAGCIHQALSRLYVHKIIYSYQNVCFITYPYTKFKLNLQQPSGALSELKPCWLGLFKTTPKTLYMLNLKTTPITNATLVLIYTSKVIISPMNENPFRKAEYPIR